MRKRSVEEARRPTAARTSASEREPKKLRGTAASGLLPASPYGSAAMSRNCSAAQPGAAVPGVGGVAALATADELLAAPPSNRSRSGFLQLMPKAASNVSHSQDLALLRSGGTREPS